MAHRRRPGPRCAAALALAVVSWLAAASGCEPRSASWRFVFDTDDLRARAAVVEARIYEGGCGGSRVLYEALISPDPGAAVPPELEAGTYGFWGQAGSADCRWFAEGCVERTLPLGDGAVIQVTLRGAPVELYCSTGHCSEGRCGGDADADLDADLEVDADAPLAAPVPRLPPNGWATGSVWAPEVVPSVAPRRPTFTWDAVAGASRYEIQLQACEGALASCEPSSAPTESVDEASYTPTTPLSVDTTAPVGQRYVWRVRACDGGGCSEWSATRYVDVARLPSDFNGDGYSDVAISAVDFTDTQPAEGTVFVFSGSAAGLGAGGHRLASPAPESGGQFGFSLGAAGDVNADGFADLVVGSRGGDAVTIYLGGAAGLTGAERITIAGPEGSQFGLSVAGAGDVDADGYADVVVGAPLDAAPSGRVYLYRGTADGVDEAPLVALDNPTSPRGGAMGCSVAGAGDVDLDGYADVVVGAYLNLGGGQVYVFNGGPAGPDAAPTVELVHPLGDPAGSFGVVVSAAGDVNGDGFHDVIASDTPPTDAVAEPGTVFLFEGGPSGLIPTCRGVLTSPEAEDDGHFGLRAASAGDVDRDGVADVLLGAPGEDSAVEDGGQAHLFTGSATGLAPGRLLMNPDATQMNAGFGLSLANAGDVDGDGWADVVVGAPLQGEARGAAFLYSAVDAVLPEVPTRNITSPSPQAGAGFGYALETGLGPWNPGPPL